MWTTASLCNNNKHHTLSVPNPGVNSSEHWLYSTTYRALRQRTQYLTVWYRLGTLKVTQNKSFWFHPPPALCPSFYSKLIYKSQNSSSLIQAIKPGQGTLWPCPFSIQCLHVTVWPVPYRREMNFTQRTQEGSEQAGPLGHPHLQPMIHAFFSLTFLHGYPSPLSLNLALDISLGLCIFLAQSFHVT